MQQSTGSDYGLSQSSQPVPDATNSQLSADGGFVRFLRGCIPHVPYRHLALRELADHFMHHHEFVNAQNLLRQYVEEYPFSGDPEVHGRLGICLVELLFRDFESHNKELVQGKRSLVVHQDQLRA